MARTSCSGCPEMAPSCRTSRTPFSTAGMNWVGITPPTTSLTNSNPSPRGNGSMRRKTSPNCPAPPVCFLCRWCPSALDVTVSRYAIDGSAVDTLTPYFCSSSSRTTRRCNSPMPRSTVSFIEATWSRRSVGSSAQNTPSPSLAFCASASVSVLMARPYIGSGKGSDSRRASSCSWSSCRTAPKKTSSARGMAPMSPAVAASTSVCSLPFSFRRWLILSGLRASPTNTCPPRRNVPWWTRKIAMRPRKGSMSTLTTCAIASAPGSGDTAIGAAASPATNAGGLPSPGDGISFSNTSSSSGMPAPVAADVKHTGTRCPSRRAVSNASCNWSAETSPWSRYASIRSSSTSTTWSTICSCADSTEPMSVSSPSSRKNTSTTRAPPSAGRLSGRHSEPKTVRICSSTAAVSAPSASIRLTTIMRQSRRSAAASMARCVIISTPVAALTTTAAVSTAGSTASMRPTKSGWPGVSSRFTCTPPWSK